MIKKTQIALLFFFLILGSFCCAQNIPAPDAPNISDLEDVTGGNNGETVTQTVPFEIVSVTINPNRDIIVSGPNGEQITIPGGSNTVITGSNGQIYNVDSQGNVTGPFTPAPGGATTPQNTDGVSASGLTTEFTAQGITVTFEPTTTTKYSWDVVPDTAPSYIKDKYAKVGSAYLPYKAVVNGQSDVLKAKITITDTKINKKDLFIKTNTGKLITFDSISNLLTLRGSLSYAEEEVQAVIKQGDKYKVAGAFKLVHLSEKPVTITLVPLNSTNSIPTTAITNLEAVYAKAGVKLTVKTAPVLTYDGGGDNKITTSDSDIFDYYTDEEKAINAQLKALPNYDPKTYYLIYSNLPSDKGIDGFMALGGQFGYIFTPPSGVGGLKTAPHELAHGVFALQHPFSTDGDKGKTPFLMDYGTGTELWHNDWAQINNPALKYYGFQSSGDGEFAGIRLTPDWKLFKYDGSSEHGDSKSCINNGGICKIFKDGNEYSYSKEKNDYYFNDEKLGIEIVNSAQSVVVIDYSAGCGKLYDVNLNQLKSIFNSNSVVEFSNSIFKFNSDVSCSSTIDCGNSISKNENINNLLSEVDNCGAFFDVNISITDDEAKKQLCAQDRYKLVKCLSSGNVVNEDENLIIKILENTPTSQFKQLLVYFVNDTSGVLKNIQNGFQLGNYKRIYELLTKIYQEGSDPALIQLEIKRIKNLYSNYSPKPPYLKDFPALKRMYWLNRGFLERLADFDMNSLTVKNEEASINDKGEISFTIDYNQFVLTGWITQSAEYANIPPFSIVQFILESDEPNLNDAKKGDEVYAPAFIVPFLINEKYNREALSAINSAIIIGTLGTASALEGTAAVIIAGLDISVSAGMLVIDSYQSQIAQSEYGRLFLTSFNAFSQAYGLFMAGRLAVSAFKVSANLMKTAWMNYKNSNGFANWKQLNPSAANRLENEINNTLREVDNLPVTGAGSLSSKLISKGLSSSVADDIVLRAMYIDDVIGINKMQSMIDELVSSPKFKNPEDLAENLKSVFSGNNVSASNAKNLLKEFEEGKYWMNQGDEVFISKKWSANADEVDVTITTKNTIVECKNLSGNDLRGLVVDIIKKYTIESKLSSAIKSQYPNHFGKITISNTSNEFYNLNKQQIINKFRQDLFPNINNSGIDKAKLIGAVKELHIENGQGRFIIKNTDW